MSPWPMVPLGEVVRLAPDPHPVEGHKEYPSVGVYGFGRGLFKKAPVLGSSISAKTLFRVRTGQFMYSRLKAFEGAFALVGPEQDGAFVTNEFPTFDCEPQKLDVRYLEAFFRRPAAWKHAASLSAGIGARRERLQPEQFLQLCIPLPPLTEQRRLVERIDAVAAKVTEADTCTDRITEELGHLLTGAYHRIADQAPRKRLGELAPLTRRPATVDPFSQYPQVSVRSFGKGTFHNPPLLGSEITWEKPHLVRAGDILISNIKAWEGAIAVARPEDDGRYGSHRYLTYVPNEGVATARFVCFYLLTPEGLHHVGEASPGSADRNRTLNSKALLDVPIPVPAYQQQLWFGELHDKVDAIRQLQAQTKDGREKLLPAVLDRAFRGEL